MFDLKIKILVVDDMLTMRKLVQKACKEIGFTTFVEAPDGRKAWEILNATPDIALVLSDWNMPESTGLDLLKRVRSDTRFKTLPFLLITAEAEKDQVIEAIKAGASNYVIKPFTTDSIRDKLEAVHKKISGAA
jgi:two-component system chemotaxis response regulator CheY